MADTNDQTGTGTPDGTENSGGEQGSKRSPDSIAAEMNRKFDKIQQENLRLSQQIEALTGAITQQNASRSKSVTQEVDEDVNLEDLAFKDPRAFAAKVKQQAVQGAQQILSQTIDQQNSSNKILGQLVSDYPELSDGNSELTKSAVALYKQMSEQERSNPLAYKAAVRDAAADLGLLPKSKRVSQSNDEFQFSASNPRGDSGNQESRSKKSSELDGKTAAFAKLIGLDTSKKEVVDRLKSRQQRKNWSKYE